MEIILLTTQHELANTINQVLDERERQQARKAEMKSFTINKVAHKLGRAHATIKKYVDKGMLSVGNDGRITQTELERFMNTEYEILNYSHKKQS